MCPKPGEILSHLYWSLIGGENFYYQGLPAPSNSGGLGKAVEILDAGGQHRWCVCSIPNPDAATAWQKEAFWGIGLKKSLLPWRQPIPARGTSGPGH